MADREIFPTPLVKQVSFEVRYPNLFFIEGRIGEFQIQIMRDFPQSELLHRKALMLVAGNAEAAQFEELAKQQNANVDKIWKFSSETGPTLEISSRNLVLNSTKHTSYDQGGEKAFRSVIEKVVSRFVHVVQIPIALRVGLRYVNECPIFDRATARFKNCYNSVLPVDRFGLENVVNADCGVVAQRNQVQMRHLESLRFVPNNDHLLLDIDSWKENVPSASVMDCADALHDIVADEFSATIREPILEYMRTAKV